MAATRVLVIAVTGLCLVSGCASLYLHRAPPSPRQIWPLDSDGGSVRRPTVAAPPIAHDHVYSLPELVDLAESTNPDTRIGWQRARQAALAVGVPLAGYFPVVSALTLVGYQHTWFPAPNLGGSIFGVNPFQLLPSISFPVPKLPQLSDQIGVDTWQVLPFLDVRWEVFNLGRAAEVRAAENNSTAANALFTAEHERIIFEVARAFFRLNAARAQVAVTRDALERTRAIAKSAEARYAQGVATVVDTAEARREVAQSEYALTQAQSSEIAARAALVSAVGIEPMAEIQVAGNASDLLPRRLRQPVEAYVEQALRARADLRAARARLPAADATVSRSKAAYAPRVTLSGTGGVAVLGAHIDRVDLPTLTLPNFTAGVTFDWLLFDGGLREVQAEMARSQNAEAQGQLLKLQHQVVQEVVTSYNELDASLSRYQAATALLEAAITAEAAVTTSYANGLATFSDAMNAQKARSLASAAKEQAFADALVAATTLAFVAGDLLSAKTLPQPP
jgi:outer membrane protein TolC